MMLRTLAALLLCLPLAAPAAEQGARAHTAGPSVRVFVPPLQRTAGQDVALALRTVAAGSNKPRTSAPPADNALAAAFARAKRR